ncbi:phage tail tape measure protein [Proteiniphilum propionicum]|uniref:phage tail tape measure protein n=1 Tax=Proteiniphilum propionicum TaxID=2829812 RepID=UPI001EEAD524|nr:phage tail tape measure protein [Proteiniphilum propionicum]ULB33014.1 phage tail tape measure protein [Proteiniphilum propionicum]
MAKRDLNRSIKIFIDNSDAMTNVESLEKKMGELRAELQKLDAQGQKDSKTSKTKERELKQLEQSYGNYQNKVRETERILKNLSGATYNELRKTRNLLRRELSETTKGTDKYNAILKNLTATQKQLNISQKEMYGTLGRQKSVMSRVTDGFNKYGAILASTIASITGVSFALRKLSQDAAAMDDVYADVMKTTGMTKDEVLELNEVFKQMDTRTSREQLNMLARDAGKLGLQSREDILGFVTAANQIDVALGEDLGEGAVREVGKMVDVFTKSTHELENLDLEGKMLAVGSAINELGASSSTQEDYLVQFAGRLGGVASQANIGIDAILGFASVLDQDMQKVEMSATALQQVIVKMMGEPAKFAQIAGVEVSKFTELVRTDANEAIKVLLRSLNERGGFQELIPLFDEMGLSGTRAVGVISSLASSVDKIDEAQQIANKTMIEATSLTEEYNIKNNNANAELEKRRKAFKDSSEELGKRLNPALLKSTNIVTYIVKLLPAVLDFFEKWGKCIMYMVTAYAAYTVGVKIAAMWEKRLGLELTKTNVIMAIKNARLKAGRALTLAYAAASALLTGNLAKARKAWRLLNATMATNPIGLLMVGITAAVAGLIKLVQWINRTNAATKAIKNATKEFNNELATETREANSLFEALQKTNPESDTFLQIRKEIISRYGKYLQGLIDEEGNITDIGKAINAVNNGLREQIALKVKNQAADKITTDSLDKQLKITDKAMKRIGKQVDDEPILSSIRETINRTVSQFTAQGGNDYDKLQRQLLQDIQQTYGIDAYKGVFNVKNVIEDLVSEVKNSSEALDEVDQRFSGIITKLTDVSSVIQDIESEDDPNPTPLGTSTATEYEKALKRLEDYIAKEKAAIQWKYVNGIISQEEYNRELEYLEMERLRKNLELAGLTFEQQQEIELKLFDMKKTMLQKIQDEERAHQAKLLEIQEKADKARAEQNWANLKAIAKQNEEQAKIQFEADLKQKADLASLGFDFANEMGTLVGGALSGNEDIVQSSLKTLINMALDALKVQVQIAIAGATATSLAQPDSVATFGASGFARAAVLVGLIEAAFAVAKSAVNGAFNNRATQNIQVNSDTVVEGARVPQRATGKYDVVGADDGRTYRGVPYKGIAQTGFVSTPTLMGEQGRELVVSAPDLSRLQRHINYPMIINAINDARSGTVPQRASGNYSQTEQTIQQVSTFDPILLAEVRDLLKSLSKGIPASVSLTEIQQKQNLQNASRKIGSK